MDKLPIVFCETVVSLLNRQHTQRPWFRTHNVWSVSFFNKKKRFFKKHFPLSVSFYRVNGRWNAVICDERQPYTYEDLRAWFREDDVRILCVSFYDLECRHSWMFPLEGEKTMQKIFWCCIWHFDNPRVEFDLKEENSTADDEMIVKEVEKWRVRTIKIKSKRDIYANLIAKGICTFSDNN